MYGYEKKTVNNINFQSNLAKKGKHKDERIVLKRQDARFVQKTNKPIQENVIQRVGEEEFVAEEVGNLGIMRGNVKGDIIATNGVSFGLVKKMPEIIKAVMDKLKENYNDERVQAVFGAEETRANIEKSELFIHALVVEHLKMGNCLDFSTLTFAKLVNIGYEKWIYRCYLDGKIKEMEKDNYIVIVRYKKGECFDISNPGTYDKGTVEVFKNRARMRITFSEYVNGENRRKKKLEKITLLGTGEPKPFNVEWEEVKYTLSAETETERLADHAFVITYNQEVANISDMEDESNAIVVDTWGKLPPMPLPSFLNGQNPDKYMLKKEDIKISKKQKSEGAPFDFSIIDSMVGETVENCAKEYVEKNESNITASYNLLKAGVKINKVYDL